MKERAKDSIFFGDVQVGIFIAQGPKRRVWSYIHISSCSTNIVEASLGVFIQNGFNGPIV